MRIVDIREQTLSISRYGEPAQVVSNLDNPGTLTTSIVAVVTDLQRDGKPVVGYGFASFGRYGQGGLIRERFAPRLLRAEAAALTTPQASSIGAGNLDPMRAWAVMMRGEKAGGHGERCVAVGALDMAIWDAAAKIAGLPLHRFLAEHTGSLPSPPSPPPTPSLATAEQATTGQASTGQASTGQASTGQATVDQAPTSRATGSRVPVYASGGYLYPADDLARLADEMHGFLDQGYTHLKIKIGAASQAEDLQRIETVLKLLPSPAHLAVDAMNAYGHEDAVRMASVLSPVGLRWFEDLCDPLDFDTQAHVASFYAPPIAAGEALFSLAEAKLLHRHGGLRPDRDILLFDPVHCYGLTHYLEIVAAFEQAGWPRTAFWPHGGHLFSLQIAAALGLGGAEMNPRSFQPFGGLAETAALSDGHVLLDGCAGPPDMPGIGLESRPALLDLLNRL